MGYDDAEGIRRYYYYFFPGLNNFSTHESKFYSTGQEFCSGSIGDSLKEFLSGCLIISFPKFYLCYS